MKRITTPLVLGLTALGAASALGQVQTLLNHDFGPGVRDNQDLPNSSIWYKGGGSAVELNASPGQLVFVRPESGSQLIGTNFVANTAGYTLAVGEAIVMRYTFSADAVGTPAFNTDNRMGLFSYAAAPSFRPGEDIGSANGPGGGAGTPVTGYMINFHVSSALDASPFDIRKRTDIEQANLLSSLGHFTSLSKATDLEADGGLLSDQVYTIEFSIARTGAGEATLTASYLDSALNLLAQVSAVDNSSPYFTYDAFLYRAANNPSKGGAHTITGFSVEVIPEPSTYAAIFGVIALAAVVFIRRRRTTAA
ncbi:MAG: PEP-CTERM sorting domain-containing protein [Opitutales bacterium]|nr:PEP-CTERM sorting domain-containing protein [Opitutales bacterium]